MASSSFPLSGVIGIVANSRDEILQARQHNLQCVEMRPDLLLDQGSSLDDVMAMVEEISDCGLHCLFTLRRHDQGGRFRGSDQEQMELCLQAASAGAHVVDIEWDSECAAALIASGVPTILSHHDFSGMPVESELESITSIVSALKPAAIKMVPTALCFEDAVRILRWVARADSMTPRIGFAMGAMGEFSRILARSFGSPITYAAFGAPVAPGQIAIDPLLSRYRAGTLHAKTRVIGVAGERGEIEPWLDMLNQSDQGVKNKLVAVPVQPDDFETIRVNAEFLRMDVLIVAESQSALIPQSVSGLTAKTGARIIDLHTDSGRSAAGSEKHDPAVEAGNINAILNYVKGLI